MIRQAIAAYVSDWERMGHPMPMHRFILRNGFVHKAAPLKGPQMEKKECFKNAAEFVAMKRNVRYAEGFATRPDIGMLIHHAWAIDDDDQVIDPTWDRPEECFYMGIVLTSGEVWSELRRNDFYGVLDTGRGTNFRFMGERDPAMMEEIKLMQMVQIGVAI